MSDPSFVEEMVTITKREYLDLLQRAGGLSKAGGVNERQYVRWLTTSSITKDPELVEFILERYKHVTGPELRDLIIQHFEADRVPSLGVIYRFIRHLKRCWKESQN